MASVGNRHKISLGSGYGPSSVMYEQAQDFKRVADNILNEEQINIFTNPYDVLYNANSKEAMKSAFVEQSADPDSFSSPELYQEHLNDMGEYFENDCEALLEYAPMVSFNPVIGMTFPIHKNILMNMMFDKAIPKFVAREPKFTLTMETRYLVTPDGQEIDMFLQQNRMFAAIESTAPLMDTIINLPENGATDVLATTFKVDSSVNNLSIESEITQVLVQAYIKAGEVYWDVASQKDAVAANDIPTGHVWVTIKPARFAPNYGDIKRAMTSRFEIKVRQNEAAETADNKIKVISGALMGYTENNRFWIDTTNKEVLAVKLTSRLDTSTAMLRTCSVKWNTRTDLVEIPNAIPINTTISPEEVKDIGALYNINQLTKIMSMFQVVLGNYRDDRIHKFLDNSFMRIPQANKIAKTFDFAPREGYYSDHVEWLNKTFMWALESYVTQMLQVLNDPNMTISIIGNTDLIRKITPAATQWTYSTPSNIGPVQMEYKCTVVSADKRVYNFMSSDKMRNNKNLIIILCPRNTERIVYRIYDYQLYVSNEIRNVQNYALPAIHAFDRFKCVEYQPVQGRLKILNPTGLRDYVPNDDPIGENLMNDYTMNYPEGSTYIPEYIPEKVDHVDPNTTQPSLDR